MQIAALTIEIHEAKFHCLGPLILWLLQFSGRFSILYTLSNWHVKRAMLILSIVDATHEGPMT